MSRRLVVRGNVKVIALAMLRKTALYCFLHDGESEDIRRIHKC